MEKSMIFQPQKKEIVDVYGNVLKVEGADAANLQLNNAFTSVRNITASCFAIKQTAFGEITPKPEWYDGLHSKFNDVKSYADTWLNDYAVAVTSAIPSSVISYAPYFQSGADVINAIIKENPGLLTPTQKQTTVAILTRMISKVEEITEKVRKYAYVDANGKTKGLLPDWQAGMSDAALSLAEGTDTVQKAVSDIAEEITNLNSEIKTLQADIEYYNKLVSAGAGMVGGGAFMAAVGGALCLVCPLAGGITLFFGIGSVVAGSSVWGVYQGKINSANERITKCLSEIAEKNKRMAAITLISEECSSVVSYANLAVKNMSDFTTSWMVFGDTLKETLSNLNAANSPEEEIGVLMGMSFASANKQWQKSCDFAEQLLAAPAEVKKVNASEIGTAA